MRRFCCVHPGAMLLSQPCHCCEPEGCLTSLAPACFCCLLCCASASPLDLPQPTRSKHSRTTSRRQHGIPLSITRMDAIPRPHGCILAPRCLPRLAYLANSPFPPQRDSVNIPSPFTAILAIRPLIQCGIPNRHTTLDCLQPCVSASSTPNLGYITISGAGATVIPCRSKFINNGPAWYPPGPGNSVPSGCLLY